MIDNAVAQLVRYAEQTGLIAPEDHVWAVNSLLEMLRLDSYTEPALSDTPIDLPAVLDALLDEIRALPMPDDLDALRIPSLEEAAP